MGRYKPGLLGTRADRFARLVRAVLAHRKAKLRPLRLLDVGALNGLQLRWELLRRGGVVEPILVEPDPGEAARLRSAYPGALVIEAALGARDEQAMLYFARDPGKSSLLRPDLGRIAQFEPVEAWEIVREVPITVRPLDDVMVGHAPADFMKIDVQGYELEVLKGAQQTLQGVLAIELETSAIPIYKGQPTLSEVTAWLLDRGFKCVAVKTTGTFGGEGIRAVEFDCFFVNTALEKQNEAALAIWRTTNRLRRGGSWDLY